MTGVPYVIVYVGYEGIEAILWVGSANYATDQVKLYRLQCERIAELDDDTRYDRYEYPWSSFTDPKRICVMRQRGDHFQCCCEDLGVGLPERILY